MTLSYIIINVTVMTLMHRGIRAGFHQLHAGRLVRFQRERVAFLFHHLIPVHVLERQPVTPALRHHKRSLQPTRRRHAKHRIS